MHNFIAKLVCIILLSCGLQACSNTSEKVTVDEYADWTAEKFYRKAKDSLDNESFQKAVKLYEQLEARFPFGTYAAQAQLDVAYAYYKSEESESALAAVERFIKLHPRNPHVDYAYYLKGLINYNRGIGFLERYVPTDISKRDAGKARDAYENFAELAKKFPQSKYLNDAQQRMLALRNNLAMYEIHVARYYMKRKAYIAAVNRSNEVIKKFPRTPAIPHALKIAEEAYLKLGMNDLAADVTRIYAHNYAEDSTLPDGIAPENRSIGRKVWDFIGLDE